MLLRSGMSVQCEIKNNGTKRKNRSNKWNSRKRCKRINLVKEALQVNGDTKARIIFRKRQECIFSEKMPDMGTFTQENYPDWLMLKHGTVIIADNDTNEPVFIAKFTPFTQLKNDLEAYNDLETVSKFTMKNMRLNYPLTLNSGWIKAGRRGKSVAFGYRVAMEQGWCYGRYMPNKAVQKNEMKLQEWAEQQRMLSDIEAIIKKRFFCPVTYFI